MPFAPDVISADVIDDSDHRLVRTVDGLSAADLAAPSLLPGWTRAHVVAHLALNAEGLERVLTGIRRHQPTPMYDSPEARDSDIDELAAGSEAELRERFLASLHCFSRAAHAITEDERGVACERTPGGRAFTVADVPLMRWREVEIHHADLDSGYGPQDWPPPFTTVLIESMADPDWPEPFSVLARDLARTWQFGTGEGPTVTGESAALGWWLTGRDPGDAVSSNHGALPRIPAW